MNDCEKLTITRIGTKDADGNYGGFEMSAVGIENPCALYTLLKDGSILYGGYTANELDELIATPSASTS
jgi:hypothetical protein